MTVWCCIDPMRATKTRRVMEALAAGARGAARVCQGAPPRMPAPVVVWGHRWLAASLLPGVVAAGVPGWFIDNGFHDPSNGRPGGAGTYAVTYRGLGPMLLAAPDMRRMRVAMAPWRPPSAKGHVLIALPGAWHGHALGLDTAAWAATIVERVRAATDRPILVRHKGSRTPLAADLAGAHVLVAHASKAAVAAIVAGVPAVVDPASPAAPVAATSLDEIECPPTPDRAHWWASLMCQNFTLAEMRAGLAWRWMRQAETEWIAANDVPSSPRPAGVAPPAPSQDERMGWMA